MTVAPGVTIEEVPEMGIAYAIDGKGDGFATRLRNVFGNSIDGCGIESVNSSGANCGCNQISDFYTTCTFKGEVYTLEVWTRGYDELVSNNWNTWTKEVFSVKVSDFACDDCEYGIDCKAIMCALADKINAHYKKRDVRKVGSFLGRALKQQVKNRRFTVYPLFENDCTYNITHSDDTCKDCVNMTGIGGIAIDGVAEPIMF